MKGRLSASPTSLPLMETSQVDVIVKFGGACVTKKNEYQTLNRAALAKAVEAVQGLDSVIIVHGAGYEGRVYACVCLCAACACACV